MPWKAVPLAELPRVMQEDVRRTKPMAVLDLNLYGLDPGMSDVSLTIPDESPLRSLGGSAPSVGELSVRLAASLDQAVRTAFRVLMVENNRLPLVKNSTRVWARTPAIDLDVLLFDFTKDQAEVRLGMPDPTVFRRMLSRGQVLSDIAAATTQAVSREVETSLTAGLLATSLAQ